MKWKSQILIPVNLIPVVFGLWPAFWLWNAGENPYSQLCGKKSISLNGTTTIPANANITLRAINYIELQPGFSIDTGRELYLDITPCEARVVKKQD